MSKFSVQVEKLSKRYRIGKSKSHLNGRKPFWNVVTAPFSYLSNTLREPSPDEIIWALKDVSFEVEQGKAFGMIGRNGAGKSTLLKVLSRITEPTTGQALIHGRVGSLLEVGTGFHPELTGRENIYLSGAIMGMKKAEIDRKFDEIVAFAEVDKFIDTPVKRYSSGMYVRLAFGVAAHLEPEILLVDEVLAVGDAAFQKKCLGKMGDVAKTGRTVLFVSHNMVAVQNLCNQVIWLDGGKTVEEGNPSQVISHYLLTSTSSAVAEREWDDQTKAPGNDKVRLRRVYVRAGDGLTSELITMQTPLKIEVEFWNLTSAAQLSVTLHLYTEEQIVAFTTGSEETDSVWGTRPLPVGLFRSVCHIPGNFMNRGSYQVLLLIVQNTDTIIYRYENVLSFEVHDTSKRSGAWHGKESGVVHPSLEWRTQYLDGRSDVAQYC
jgi:lipopolysaccharide transport system ATP-binding protein